MFRKAFYIVRKELNQINNYYQNIISIYRKLWFLFENSYFFFYLHRTRSMYISDAPVIAHTIMHKGPNLTYVVHYYSNDLNLSITWLKYTESIANSMMYSISSAEQNVSLEVYGKRVILLGCATSLSIRRHNLGDYSVILRNAFGETKHLFQQKQGKGCF